MGAQSSSFRPYRVEVEGILELSGPLHIGTGESFSHISDSPVLRLPDETPYLPGSSIRGILRAHLEREACLLGCSADHLNCLFGRTPPHGTEGSGTLGRLTVCDAFSETHHRGALTQIRDHVHINPEWGAAAHGAKFDMEALLPEPDRRFRLRLIYEGDGPGDPEYLLFEQAVDFLSSGRTRLGAKSGWGYGRVKLDELKVREHDRSTINGLAGYLLYREGNSLESAGDLPLATFSAARTSAGTQPWAFLDMELEIKFDGPVLIKDSISPVSASMPWVSENPEPGRDFWPNDGEKCESIADMTFVKSCLDNKYYLPGSSLRGVLRHRAQAICKTVMGKPDLAETLFGYVDKKRGARKSLIEIADGKIQNGKDAGPVFFDHVAIDRIVNCAEDGAKFSASALVSPVFSVAITMRFHDEYLSELGLWGFVLRDLMEGRLWAGHGTSRGYGYIAMAELQKCALSVPGSMQLAPAEDWSLSSGRGRFIAEKNKPLLFDDLSWVWNKADDSWVKARSHASGGKS